MELFLKQQNNLLSKQELIKIKPLIIRLFCSYISYYSSLMKRGTFTIGNCGVNMPKSWEGCL